MRRINLLLQQPKRKKYRKLNRWETLYGQIYGPKLVASNFALEPWSLALGGYFTRHGQRSGATKATGRLLRQLYQGLRGLRGTHRWVLQLAEGTTQSHQRPEFLYSHLRQRFPQKNLERQRRWIKRLRRRALILDYRRRSGERRSQRAELSRRRAHPRRAQKPAPRRLWANPYQGTLSLSTVRQLPRLALLRHTQLQLWWDTPRPLLTSGRYLRLRQQQRVAAHRFSGRAPALRRGRRGPRTPVLSAAQRGRRREGLFFGAWSRLLRWLPRRGLLGRKPARRWRTTLGQWHRRLPLPRSQQKRLQRWSGLLLSHLRQRCSSRKPLAGAIQKKTPRKLPQTARNWAAALRWVRRYLRSRNAAGAPKPWLARLGERLEQGRHQRHLRRQARQRARLWAWLERLWARLRRHRRLRAMRRLPARLERLGARLERRILRLEQLSRPGAVLGYALGQALRLAQRCRRLKQLAQKSSGYRRYKARWFLKKNQLHLRRLRLSYFNQRALSQRRRSGLRRALARLLRQARRRQTALGRRLGWSTEEAPAQGSTRGAGSTPRLKRLWRRLRRAVNRLTQIWSRVSKSGSSTGAGAGSASPAQPATLGASQRRRVLVLLRRLNHKLRQRRLNPKATNPEETATPDQTQSQNPKAVAKVAAKAVAEAKTKAGAKAKAEAPREAETSGGRRSGARRRRPTPNKLAFGTRLKLPQGNRRWRLRTPKTPRPKTTEEPFDPQQWRNLINRSWPTLQPQQPYGLELYWEAPRSGQLGRWRRRSRHWARVQNRLNLRQPLEKRATRASLEERGFPRSGCQPARRLLRRRLAFQPQVHYSVRELHLQDLALLEEQEQEGLESQDFGQRYLLVTRRYGAVGYSTLLRDCFALLTPQLKLVSQVVGHKSARRTIYQVRFGVPLTVRVRALFGWLRDLVNKNEDYNLLRRNTVRKPTSKRVRDKPERGRRCTQSFHPRLTAELRRLMGADDPLLEQLALFDSRSTNVRVPRRHYRWEN